MVVGRGWSSAPLKMLFSKEKEAHLRRYYAISAPACLERSFAIEWLLADSKLHVASWMSRCSSADTPGLAEDRGSGIHAVTARDAVRGLDIRGGLMLFS